MSKLIDATTSVLENNGIRGLFLKASNYILQLVGINMIGIGYYSIYLYKKYILSINMVENPFSVVYVDPSKIQYALDNTFRWAHLGEVWGNHRNEYWSIFIWMVDYKYSRREVIWNDSIKSIDSIRKYNRLKKELECMDDDPCSDIRRLYEKIAKEGYKSQEDIHGKNIRELSLSTNFDKTKEEIAVAIGPEGDILMIDGWHRLVIAQYLNIEEIPVHVVIRHSDWNALREKLRDTNDISILSDREVKILDHPDIPVTRGNT